MNYDDWDKELNNINESRVNSIWKTEFAVCK